MLTTIFLKIISFINSVYNNVYTYINLWIKVKFDEFRIK